MKKFDGVLLSFLVCFLLPLIILLSSLAIIAKQDFLLYLTNWNTSPYNLFFSQYLMLCMVPDMALLFWAYKTERWQFCRGAVVGFTPYLCMLIYLMG